VDNESENIIPGPELGYLMRAALGRLPRGGIGAAHHPLFVKHCRRSVSNAIPEAILTGHPYPIKAVVIVAANPAVMMPNTSRFHKALRKPDLFVIQDAQCYGIADGDWVQVESLRGTAEMRAKVTEDISVALKANL
jgi:anaerobic selenocysteine-containing dehydrogenase